MFLTKWNKTIVGTTVAFYITESPDGMRGDEFPRAVDATTIVGTHACRIKHLSKETLNTP